MSSCTSGARRTGERELPGVAAAEPRSYDLPDFPDPRRRPYPPILLEASSGQVTASAAGWSEQVEHAGYCCRPIRRS